MEQSMDRSTELLLAGELEKTQRVQVLTDLWEVALKSSLGWRTAGLVSEELTEGFFLRKERQEKLAWVVTLPTLREPREEQTQERDYCECSEDSC